MGWLTGCFKITSASFVQAIREHLETDGRVFCKRERNSGRLLPNKLQASVWIREPDDDNDYDDGTVYVEFILTPAGVVLIYDAHAHEDYGRGMRLPF